MTAIHNRKKRIRLILLFAAVLLALLSGTSRPAVAADGVSLRELGAESSDPEQVFGEYVDDLTDEIDFSAFEDFFNDLDGKVKEIFANQSFAELLDKTLNGEGAVDFPGLVQAFFSAFFVNLSGYLPVMILILAVCVLSGIFHNLRSGFADKSTSQAVHFVTFLTVAVILVFAAVQMFELVKNTITTMKNFLNLTFPLILTMMTASGGMVSSRIFQPLAAILLGGMTQLIVSVIFPLFLVINVFTLLNCLTDSVKLDKLNDFFKSVVHWVLGISFTVFMSFLLIQGITGGVYDGVSVRAAKYTIANSVPTAEGAIQLAMEELPITLHEARVLVVGGYLSSGFDLVVGSCVLVKNAVGVTGLVVIVGMILPPLAQILCFNLSLKLTAGLAQPLTDEKTSNFLSATSKNFSLLLTVLLSASFMYFVTLTLFILSSNSVFL